MSKQTNLNMFLKDTADAIRTKKGTTELINPQDFRTEIESIGSNTGSGGNGGGELEGEYYLAKPNGRYWKSKLAHIERGKYPAVMTQDLSEETIEAYMSCSEIMSLLSFSAIGDYGGIPDSGTEVWLKHPIAVIDRAENDQLAIRRVMNGESIFINALGAWQESSFCLAYEEGLLRLDGLIELIRIDFGEDEMTDDEILAMVSEMFMIEQVTKEEYESWHNW